MSDPLRAVLAIALSLLAWVGMCATASAAEHVPRELVVKYRAGTTSQERDAIRHAAGVRTTDTIDGSTQTVAVPDTETTEEAAAKLEANPGVLHAVPNYVATATAFTPNDPGRGTPGADTRKGCLSRETPLPARAWGQLSPSREPRVTSTVWVLPSRV